MIIIALIRVILVLALIALLLIPSLLAFFFPWARYLITKIFFKAILKIYNIKISIKGRLCKEKCLFISNHISFWDIFIFGSVIDVSYTPKDVVKKWPLLGYMISVSNPIWINRDSKKAILASNLKLQQAILSRNIMLYPEGTTSKGDIILPFKSSLFEFVINKNINIQPVIIRVNNTARQKRAYAYIDDDNILKQFWQYGFYFRTDITLDFLPCSNGVNYNSRKELSQYLHQQMTENFNGSSE